MTMTYIEFSDDTVDALSKPGAIRAILHSFKMLEAIDGLSADEAAKVIRRTSRNSNHE